MSGCGETGSQGVWVCWSQTEGERRPDMIHPGSGEGKAMTHLETLGRMSRWDRSFAGQLWAAGNRCLGDDASITTIESRRLTRFPRNGRQDTVGGRMGAGKECAACGLDVVPGCGRE